MSFNVLSCCGPRKHRDVEDDPLLPESDHDTALQARLHHKFRTYHMFRALTHGFIPSNDQVIILFRALVAADLLNPSQSAVSDSGRILAKSTRQLLQQLIDLLRNKNSDDQLQDSIWLLCHSEVLVDAQDLSQRLAKTQKRANISAGKLHADSRLTPYLPSQASQGIQTIGSLLLSNSDFRIFLADLQTISREVFRDVAQSTSKTAKNIGQELAPPGRGTDAIAVVQTDRNAAPDEQELVDNFKDASETVANGAVRVGEQAVSSATDHLSGSERSIMLDRLQKSISNLRQRPDYSTSVSAVATFLKRLLFAYTRTIENSVGTIEDDVHGNSELNQALRTLGHFVSSFGSSNEWNELGRQFSSLAAKGKHSDDFEELVQRVVDFAQQLMLDPSLLRNADTEVNNLPSVSTKTSKDNTMVDDMKSFLEQIRQTLHSVAQDQQLSAISHTSLQILSIFSPPDSFLNQDLVTDLSSVFLPLAIQAVQHIPIPRLEVATPDVDLLLENLVFEPGETINHSSFLPFRFRIDTYNDLEIRKTYTSRNVSGTSSSFTIKIDGLSLRTEDVGFWLNAHSGLLRFHDEGIMSLFLDKRGIDINLDVDVGRDGLEKLLSLRAVRVRIHTFDYTIRKSRFSILLSSLLKPFLRPVLRRTLQRYVAHSIADLFHAANRELVFARERLRATRVADPDDLWTFFRAVAARLAPEENPDVDIRVGADQPGKGVFREVYAPGSLVKLWKEEGERATETVTFERNGWRSEVFDLTGG